MSAIQLSGLLFNGKVYNILYNAKQTREKSELETVKREKSKIKGRKEKGVVEVTFCCCCIHTIHSQYS